MPANLRLQDFDDLIDGFAALAHASGTALVGGNMTRSPGPLVVDVTLLGSVRPRRVLLRSGAAAGDRLYVTGTVGAAATGLALLQAGVDRAALSDAERACLARYECPEPRVRFARIVAKTGAARAAIDLSDGLADAAVRLAEAAGLGVVIAADQVPIPAGAARWLVLGGTDAVTAALAGGEDYEVAFAVPPRRESRFRAAARRCPELQVTHVGTFQKSPGAWLQIDGRLDPISHGFDHF
jgi:thiamine-monophosphate kinase